MATKYLAGAMLTASTNPASSGNTASAHTKTGWVELIASTDADYNMLDLVGFASNADSRALFDIGFGPALSEVVKIPNLFIEGSAPTRGQLPLKIPAGTRVAFRAQTSVSNRSVAMGIGVYVDSRFSMGDAPDEYTAYGVDLATTNVTLTVTADATAHTKGAVTQVVPSVPSGAAAVVISRYTGVAAPVRFLLDLMESLDAGGTYPNTVAGNMFSLAAGTGTQAYKTVPYAGQGNTLGLRAQCSSTSGSDRSPVFAVHVGHGAVAGEAGIIIRKEIEMKRIVRNTDVAKERLVGGELYAEDGKPYTGDTSGVKCNWKLNGSGAEQTSSADIVMVSPASPAFTLQLSKAESATMAVGDTVSFYVPASIGEYKEAAFEALVYEIDFTADGRQGIADATNRDALAIFKTMKRTGPSGNGSMEWTGPDGADSTILDTNPNAEPIVEIDTGS